MDTVDVRGELRGEPHGMAARFHFKVRNIRFTRDVDVTQRAAELSLRRKHARNAVIDAQIGVLRMCTCRRWLFFPDRSCP